MLHFAYRRSTTRRRCGHVGEGRARPSKKRKQTLNIRNLLEMGFDTPDDPGSEYTAAFSGYKVSLQIKDYMTGAPTEQLHGKSEECFISYSLLSSTLISHKS